jgi:hypothetical protein
MARKGLDDDWGGDLEGGEKKSGGIFGFIKNVADGVKANLEASRALQKDREERQKMADEDYAVRHGHYVGTDWPEDIDGKKKKKGFFG